MPKKDYPKDYTYRSIAEERKYGFFWYSWLWQAARPILIGVISLLIVTGVCLKAWDKVDETLLRPPEPDSREVIEFQVTRGSTATAVGENLMDQGFIRNKGVFKYMMDFQGMGGKLQPGTFELTRGMTVQQIINMLTAGDGKSMERQITIIPGWTITDIADYLLKQGALKNAADFINACKDPEPYKDSFLIADAMKAANFARRVIALEGYLAPDTYRIYTDATIPDIIDTLIAQTESVIDRLAPNDDSYGEVSFDEDGNVVSESQKNKNAFKTPLTIDETMILASMIETEATNADFAKVSAVFHNRLSRKMMLGSDVTVKYAMNTKRIALSAKDLAVESPYNTYKNFGLPPGPICNPSPKAIQAALYPDMEYIDGAYLYFCMKNPEDKLMAFSKTAAQHDAYVEQYRPLWIAYDQKMGNQ